MKCALRELPHRWHLFCQYHPFADGDRLDDRSFGSDEQLEFILSAIDDGLEPDPDVIDRLSQNRSRKYRHHLKILTERFALPQFLITDDDTAFAAAAINDDIRWVRENTSDFEWTCLCALANGHSYRVVATQMHLSIGTLKSLVARCRQRLRALASAA